MAPPALLKEGMSEALAPPAAFDPARAVRVGLVALGLTLYAALAAAATVIYPPVGVLFLAPPIFGAMICAPPARASSRKVAFALLLVAAVLLAVWPVYIYAKLGPSPILTPPRAVLYVVSAFWIYDMTFSRLRRAQFVLAVRKSGAVTAAVFALFLLNLLSLPLAEGRAIAVPEFARQAIIWLLPYCATLTYCRRQRDFVALVKAFLLGAVIVGVIAVAEAATRQLFASVLAPFIADDAEWLRNAQSQKIRDGVFRAQSSHTHPLSLGEHMAMTAPFALAFLLAAREMKGRLLWGAAFLVIAVAGVATNSRGAIIVMALAMAAMGAILFYRFLRRGAASRWRPLFGLFFLGAIALAPPLAYVGNKVVSGAAGTSAANSTQSRLDQVERAWPKIMQRPVGGYGTGRSTRVLGYWGRTLTIDNYYLSLALDLGLPGPIAFFSILAAWGAAGLKRSRRCHPSLGVLYVACFAAASSVAIGRTILSQTGNLATLYVMIAAFAGASVTLSRRRWRNRI